MSATRTVGIDLGSTYSAIAYITEDGRAEIIRDGDQNRTTPSVVFFEDDAVRVGRSAREEAVAFPERVVVLVKRQMGTSETYTIGDRKLSPPEVSAHILKRLKEDAEHELKVPVTEAVITVPAYFGVAERKATEDAGRIAGLTVRHIIDEPTAAAVAFAAKASLEATKTLLVYDLGGGTFDVTILRLVPTGTGSRPLVEVLSSGGNPRLGGADWDAQMADHVVAAFRTEHGVDLTLSLGAKRDLLMRCESAKQALARNDKSTVSWTGEGHTVSVPFDRPLLQQLGQKLLARTEELVLDLLDKKGLKPADIDEVLLVGGSTKMVMVREMLAARFGPAKVNASLNADLCVAEGAAWYAHLLEGGGMSVRDVCPVGLGTCVITDRASKTQNVDTIIHKDQPLPCNETAVYYTESQGARVVVLRVFENRSRLKGEWVSPNLSRLVATVTLKDLPPGRAPGQPIEVTFKMDESSRFSVTGIDVNTGTTVQADIEFRSGLSGEALEAASDALASTPVRN